MRFSDAIDLLERGFLLCRRETNGMNSFIFMQKSHILKGQDIEYLKFLPEAVRNEFVRRRELISLDLRQSCYFQKLHYSNQLLSVDHENNIKTWIPTVEDLTANDWEPYKL